MRAVSNTSPISNLAIIGRLSLLRQRYGQVVVPPAVVRELQALTHRAAGESIRGAFDEGWLVMETLPDLVLAQQLGKSLDPGEAEAIALAAAGATDVVLIDERKARIVARTHNLKVAGVLGELLHAKFAGWLPSVRAEVEKLRKEARFFIDPDLEKFILSQAGE